MLSQNAKHPARTPLTHRQQDQTSGSVLFGCRIVYNGADLRISTAPAMLPRSEVFTRSAAGRLCEQKFMQRTLRVVAVLCVLRLWFWHVCVICKFTSSGVCDVDASVESRSVAWLTNGDLRHYIIVEDADADGIVVAAPQLQKARLCIQSERTGDIVHNIHRADGNDSFIFEPVAGQGRYYIYTVCTAYEMPPARPQVDRRCSGASSAAGEGGVETTVRDAQAGRAGATMANLPL